MKLKKIPLKKIGFGLIGVLIICQFFRIDKKYASIDPAMEFITVSAAPQEIASLLKTSCYDCHSNEVKYPWYTNVAPVSWWIKNHVNEGSRHLNFSIWGTYNGRRQDKKLKECVEMIEEDDMPMTSYTLIHGDAALNKEQKEKLVTWFNSIRTHESDKPKK
jgi:hypothetical protein